MVFSSLWFHVVLEEGALGEEGKDRRKERKKEEIVMQLSCLSRQGPGEYGYTGKQVEDCNVYDGEEEHEEGEDDSEEPLHQTFSKGSSDRSSLKMSIHQEKILDTVGESSH